MNRLHVPIHLPVARLARRRAAFTLVELMISIALSLMLIYGIAQVFKMSGDTVGANQAVAAIVRDHRAAMATLEEDFRNSRPDSPAFIIDSRVAYGYDPSDPKSGFKAGWKNAEEERDTGVGADPTVQDVNGSTFNVRITDGTDRTPRLDRLSFFARGMYRRQTADNSQAASTVTTADAYIWYGHTALPDDTNTTAVQPHEQYSSDRVLGRSVILMKDFGTIDPAEKALAPLPATPLYPIGYAAPTAAGDKAAYQSVKDLAPMSAQEWAWLADTTYNVRSLTGEYTNLHTWYLPLLEGPAAKQYWRAWCRPTVTRPIDQVKLAQTSPYFVGHCTQFIVEYAGDYLVQQQNDLEIPGKVTDAAVMASPVSGVPKYHSDPGGQSDGQGDGQIDYVIDTSADPADPPNDPTKWVRRVRWYGLPRDINGDGHITINDVVPLADVLAYYEVYTRRNPDATVGLATRSVGPWESQLPLTDQTDDKTSTKQGLLTAALKNTALRQRQKEQYAQQDYAKMTNADAAAFRYTCAFHNAAPPLIRITMKIEDPTGKLRDGQWYQYILHR